MKNFIQHLPKVELHLHLEGSLEPELMFKLATRNGVTTAYDSVDALRAAYEFDDLQSFLDIYYQGAGVLLHEQDFFDLTWEYLLRCKEDNVVHTEVFFDPQTHTHRGVSFDVVVLGIHKALVQGEKELGITSKLIMCFLKHLDEADAFKTLEQAAKHTDKIIGVGLDSTEIGNPMSKFQRVFEAAMELGFLTVAHAGEEGPAQNIIDALDILKVARVDHGVRCVEDDALVERLVANKIPLTVCPLSNIKLKVFDRMEDHNLVDLLRKGAQVTLNSDDPAYFGGYMVDNFMAVANAHQVTKQEFAQFTLNAIEASFISDNEKARLKEETLRYLAANS